MPQNVNLGRGETGSGATKETPPKRTAPTNSPRRNPLADVPRPALIGGGITLLALVLAGLWFMFGVGPEDSGKTVTDTAKVTTASPASAAAIAATAAEGNSGSASVSATTPPRPNAPPSPGVTSASGASASSASGAPATTTPVSAPADTPSASGAPAAGTPPREVEGSPPVNSSAGDGSTWKPGDAAGKVYRHGPASDP